MKVQIIITIDDYEISIVQAINSVNLENVHEVTVIQSYLAESNKFREVTFKVENGKIDLKNYTYKEATK